MQSIKSLLRANGLIEKYSKDPLMRAFICIAISAETCGVMSEPQDEYYLSVPEDDMDYLKDNIDALRDILTKRNE